MTNMNTTSTKIELPSHPVLNLTDGAHSDHGSADPIMAFTESRLQHWFAADYGHRARHLEEHQAQSDIDVLLSAPPVRRITMPTANLEPPRLGHLLSSMVSKLVPVRVFRLRHRHSTGS
jgi:hypothetical protein